MLYKSHIGNNQVANSKRRLCVVVVHRENIARLTLSTSGTWEMVTPLKVIPIQHTGQSSHLPPSFLILNTWILIWENNNLTIYGVCGANWFPNTLNSNSNIINCDRTLGSNDSFTTWLVWFTLCTIWINDRSKSES